MTRSIDWRRTFGLREAGVYYALLILLALLAAIAQSRGLPNYLSPQNLGNIVYQASLVGIMSSVASSVKGVPNRFAYTVTKAAVVGLTKSIAADFVGNNIRVTAICPGTVETPSLHDRLSAGGDYDGARAAFIARQPIGRIGAPEEIADLVVYLAGATYTTGQVQIVDGGWTI